MAVARRIDLLQQLQLVEIAVHIMRRSDAIGRAILLAPEDNAAIDRAFGGGRWRIGVLGLGESQRIASGSRRQRQNVAKCAWLTQLTCCEAIGTHYDFGAFGHGRAPQHTRQFQSPGVGKHRMMIISHQGERPVRQHPVKVVPRRQNFVVEDRVRDLVGENQLEARLGSGIVANSRCQRRIAMHRAEVQIVQLGRAHEKVNVPLNDAGRDRAAACVDHAGVPGLQPLHLAARPHGRDCVSRNGDGPGSRIGIVHGQDAGIADDDVGCGHRRLQKNCCLRTNSTCKVNKSRTILISSKESHSLPSS